MTRKIEEEIEQFDANDRRFLSMEEDAPLRICPICLEVSPNALGCGCFTDFMNGNTDK